MARWTIVALALLFVPLPGCLTETEPRVRLGLFAFNLVERGSPEPQPVQDCATLLAELNARALDESRVYLEQNLQNGYRHWFGGGGWAIEGDAVADSTRMTAATGTASPATPASDAQATGTNNQEAGADEADIVKTDGEWTYVLSMGVLHILHSENVGDVESYGRKEFGSDQYYYGGELLLERRDPDDPSDDRLLVVLPGQSSPVAATSPRITAEIYIEPPSMTRVVVLSLEDRRDPEIVHETWIEGMVNGARLIDGTAYVVVHDWPADLGLQTWVEESEPVSSPIFGTPEYSSAAREAARRKEAIQVDAENQEALGDLTLADHLPQILRRGSRALLEVPIDEDACRRFYTSPETTGRGVTTMYALTMGSPGIETATTEVLGGTPIVYASEDALVLAAPTQDAWWFWVQPELEEATDLQWFDLDGLEIRPKASGRVAGTVLDSFSLDVEDEELRVATTTGTWGRWWAEDVEPMMSHVAVFKAAAGVLVPNGIVGGIAPGEKIWSARFTHDRAYLVTFRQTDPLWVIDLGAEAPKILGELEIPGVSTYIHPLDDKALLTIGYGPSSDGQNLDWSSVQVSLFDLSDLAKPRRADVLNLSPPGGWSWSGATQEHKAFTYWSEIGTLAVPLSTSRSDYQTMEDGSSVWTNEQHIGLKLITVDRAGLDLRLKGEVDQDDLVASADEGWGYVVLRSYFLGVPDGGPVSVYSISGLGVTAHDLETLEIQGSAAFGG